VDELLDRRPIVIVLAGQNGAGKTTFYKTYLKPAGLRFVNADEIARDLRAGVYKAAEMADHIRRELVAAGESFIFETVFSDPVGDKIEFLKEAERAGYTVALFFIGTSGAAISDERVAMRVLKGGHDVPADKLRERYPRVMKNLQRTLIEIFNVRVYDNSDLRDPYRLVATREKGEGIELYVPTPDWLMLLLPEE